MSKNKITPLPADISQWSREDVKAAIDERVARGSELLKARVGDVDADEFHQINDELDRLKAWVQPHPGFPTRRRKDARASGAFSAAIAGAGWDPVERSRVEVPKEAALNVGFKTATWTGAIGDLQPNRVGPSYMGADRRWVYPALRQAGATIQETSVTYLRQGSRSLADPSDMIRSIDATSAKPETDVGLALASETLKQVAHVITGVPRIVAAQPEFATLVDGELQLGLNEALDAMVVAAIAAASVPAGSAGANVAEGIRKAVTAVEAAGYMPDTVALGPADAEALDLLNLTLFNSTGVRPDFGLTRRVSKAIDGLALESFVLDSTAFGTLVATPIEFASFEEEAGRTNTQTFRAELNAIAIVDRADAAATVTVSP
jgi:hypothetical protein